MEFKELSIKDYPKFLELYNSSFPEEQRRLYRDANHVANFVKMKGGKFHGFTYDDGGDDFLAFLTYWTFKGYVYIEHFAVKPEHRGKRIGSAMLNHLFSTVGEDVLIEVDCPGTDEADRRIRFYERHGFRRRGDIKYTQPPYSPEQKEVPMLLMTHGNISLHDMNDIKEMLAEVYNVKAGL